MGASTDQPDDPNTRITGVLTESQADSPTWTTSQQQAMVNQFMPPDAKMNGSKTVYLGNLVEGTEYIYSSVLLANTLPNADFKDVSGHQNSPGLFYVYFDEADSEFVLGTDEHFVQNPF